MVLSLLIMLKYTRLVQALVVSQRWVLANTSVAGKPGFSYTSYVLRDYLDAFPHRTDL